MSDEHHNLSSPEVIQVSRMLEVIIILSTRQICINLLSL